MPAEWTDAEIELLSAYIDEQLEENDRTALEARLANDADLRQELEAMQQTVALLRDLPTIRAPRAFTLTPEMVGQNPIPATEGTQLRVLPPSKQARPPRRVWWVPAASAAGVVLLAGVFVLTQQTNSSSQTPPNIAGGVALASTPTAVLEGSQLNTIVQQSVTQAPAVGAVSESTQESSTGAEIQTGTREDKDLPADGTFFDETPLLLPTDQFQGTAVGGMPAPIAPPVSAGAQTGEEQPQIAATPTLVPSATMQVMDAVVEALPTQSFGPDLSLPSGGGGVLPSPSTANGAVPTPEAIAGMTGLNTDPNAPGFSVSTLSPTQGTAIAQYNEPQSQVFQPEPEVDQESSDDQEASDAPSESPSSAVEETPRDARTAREPIWIRWFNVLSDWLERLLGQ
jgi:hypothetical protein